MSRMVMLALALLLSTAWLQAQNQYPPSGSRQNKNSSGQTSIEGCLQGPNGSFTLTDSSGTTYQLQGDTSKLSKHVGHDVQITGSTSGSGPASPGSDTPRGVSQQHTLSVDKVKHISEYIRELQNHEQITKHRAPVDEVF